jgi:hypothetical protein
MNMDCVRGLNLLQYSRSPHKLRTFLEPRADCLGKQSELAKSIVVLRGSIGSSLQMTPRQQGSEWPMLRRTGQYPPSMLIPELGNILSVDPDEQRIGCDYIDHERAAHFIARIYNTIHPLCSDLTAKELVLHSAEFDLEGLFELESDAAVERLTHLFFQNREDFLNEAEFKNILRTSLLSEAAKGLPLSLGSSPEKIERGLRLLVSALRSSSHTTSAIRHISSRPKHARFRHIVLQGCGDVSMNFWNICYLPGDSTNPPMIVHVPTEPLDNREYSSLVCWDWKNVGQEKLAAELWNRHNGAVFSAGAGRPSLSIGRLRINQYGNGKRLRLITGQHSLEIDPFVRYAVYGRRLVWAGAVVPPRTVAEEFSDLRHLFDLPNLNPSEKQVPCAKLDHEWSLARNEAIEVGFDNLFADKMPENFRQRPRYMFNIPALHDVWLAERFLLGSPVMVQHACEHPIEVEAAELGAPWDWVTLCLRATRYKLKRSPEEVSVRGDFTWDMIDPAKPKLVVFFHTASYPCTLVGIGKLGGARNPDGSEAQGDLFLLAWGHGFNMDQEYSVFTCAEFLMDLGAEAVLLMDEGRDVFQHVFDDYAQLERYEQEIHQSDGRLSDSTPFPVPADREQIRATLAFWVGADGSGDGR